VPPEKVNYAFPGESSREKKRKGRTRGGGFWWGVQVGIPRTSIWAEAELGKGNLREDEL